MGGKIATFHAEKGRIVGAGLGLLATSAGAVFLLRGNLLALLLIVGGLIELGKVAVQSDYSITLKNSNPPP